MLPCTDSYSSLVKRNWGYISSETQSKIAASRLLIAGCGMGSAPAVCATRTGFQNFILVDGDVVDAHNLNRQFYIAKDIGKPKVESLKSHILEINPDATVEAINANLNVDNIPEIVSRSDIIFDTVDFVDMNAVLALHEEAQRQSKPLFTAVNVGFGALVWYIEPGSRRTWPDLIKEDRETVKRMGGDPHSYGEVYLQFVSRFMPELDKEVIEVINSVLVELKEGRACPTPQIAVGSFSVAALAVTMIHDHLAGLPMIESPKLVIHSYRSMRTKIIEV